MVVRGILKFILKAVIFLLLTVIVLGVIAFFVIKSLDPNIFRVELEKQLTQKTGLRVELGKIEVDWGPQMSFRLDMLKFYNPQSLDKLLQSDSVSIEADLASLVRKQFWMPVVRIQNPEVFIKRRMNGSWSWQGAGAVEPVPGDSGMIPVAHAADAGNLGPKLPPNFSLLPAAWAFGLGKVEIEDGTIHYVDETVQPAFALDVVKCDAELIPNSALSGFHFTTQASVYNVVERKLEIEGDMDIVSQTLDFNGKYDNDRVLLKGALKLVGSLPNIEGTMKVRDLDLEGLVPSSYKEREYLSGILNADLRLKSIGGNPEALLKALSGNGSVRVENGSLKNRNLIKEVFEKMSPVIAVVSALGGELPPEMAAMMQGPNTDFQKATVDFTLGQGTAMVQDFLLFHPNYQLSGKGTYEFFTRKVDLDVSLIFSKSISGYFTKKIHELSMLSDQNGLVSIPFRYNGIVPDAEVKPDLNYIGNRLLQVGAQELIARGLEKLSKILEPITQPVAPQQETSVSSVTTDSNLAE